MKASKSTTNITKVEKRLKAARRSVNKANRHVLNHIQKWLVDRRDNFLAVRRSVTLWLAVVLILVVVSIVQTTIYSKDNLTKTSVAGGVYAEGVVDKITTVNPILASTDTEKALGAMVYRGLLSYDESNVLKGDLADKWSVEPDGVTWTVRLKSNLFWSDGKPLTADDVVFTLDLIKNKGLNSPMYNSYETVSVKKEDDRTLKFTTPNVYMPFPTALTFGVLPKHILSGKSVTEINNMSLQTPGRIAGSGPFISKSVENQRDGQTVWSFVSNKYYQGSAPRLDRVTVRTYTSQDAMIKGLRRGEVNAISNVRIDDINNLAKNYQVSQVTTADGVYALFNTDGELTGSLEMRNALRLAIDLPALRKDIISGVGSVRQPRALETPIAAGVYGEADQMKQPTANAKAAGEILGKLGWIKKDGAKYRTNGDKVLTINMVTLKGTNYKSVAGIIAEQWRKVGVNTKIQTVDPSTAQQEVLSPRSYDVLIYQLHLGADPDEYAYWSSTQTGSTGLNYSNYSSKRAELLLSNGRTAMNPALRKSRYLTFVKQWQQDNPAVALYQPSLYLATDKSVSALENGSLLIDSSNRYRGIEQWTVRRGSVKATP